MGTRQIGEDVVVALSPVVLAVTGVVMWWVRRKRVQVAKARRQAQRSMGST